MTPRSFKDTAELIGIAAIVASLVFVGLQMRQDQAIARAELGSDTFDYVRSINQTMQNPQFASTYLKILGNQDDLSDEEKIVVNAFLEQVIGVIVRECYLVYVEVFPDCMAIAEKLIPPHFGNSYAKAYWHATKYLRLQPMFEMFTPIIDNQSDEESFRLFREAGQ
jgi:hypothetical protein